MIAKRTFPPGELARTPANTVATKPMDAHFLFAFTQTQNSLRFCTEASRGPILSAPKNLSGFVAIKNPIDWTHLSERAFFQCDGPFKNEY